MVYLYFISNKCMYINYAFLSEIFFVICPATYAEYYLILLEVTHIPLIMQKPGKCRLRFLRWKTLLGRFPSMAEPCLQHPNIFAGLLDCCFQTWEAGRSWEIQVGHPKCASALMLAAGRVALPAALPLPWCPKPADPMQLELPTLTKVCGTIYRRICRS